MEDLFANEQELVSLRYKDDYVNYDSIIEETYLLCKNAIREMVRKAKGGIIYVKDVDMTFLQIDEDDNESVFDFSRITFNHEGIKVFNPELDIWFTITCKESWIKLYDLIHNYGEEYK